LIINELMQWAALLFMGVFLFGLTRQLGNFLVTGRDRAAVEAGPEVGDRLPKEVLAAAQRERLAALMGERGHDHAVLVVVGEECSACKGLLDSIRDDASPDRVPVAALTQSAGDEYARLLGATADVVAVDGPALEKANLVVTPFAVLVDRDFRVLHKQLAWKLAEVLTGWEERRDGGRARRFAANGNGSDQVVVEIGGGSR
jgi:hypothetical protein